MQEAQYGRMKLGGCVKHDFGYIGCKATVRNILDELCSGKRGCKVKIHDIETTQGCIEGLEKYLEASYNCVPGTVCVYNAYFYSMIIVSSRKIFILALLFINLLIILAILYLK